MTHRPKKRLGQHFLVDPTIARRIVKSLHPSNRGPIVEIGPGRGVLTEFLSELSRPVFAIEKDRDLASALQDKYGHLEDIHIIPGDILRFDFHALFEKQDRKNLSLIGNIPFQITSPLLDLVLNHRELFAESILMIQKEVADRLLSPPGSRVYGGLSVIFNYFTTVEHLLDVKKGSFFPVPEVEATVIRIRTATSDILRVRNEIFFVQVVRTLFNWRRKQVQTTLKRHNDFLLHPEEMDELRRVLDYPLSRRPEELSVRDFVRLSNELSAIRDFCDFPQPGSK